MSTSTTPSPPAQQSFATNWNLAGERARERVIRLQEQRTREAASQSRILRFFDTGRNGSDTFRVGQLDAELLDEELLELLKAQLWGGLKYFRVCMLLLHLLRTLNPTYTIC
jgi:peroxin-2